MTQAARLLIIDDEEAIRDSMGQVLAKEGYIVKTVERGGDGLALFSPEAFQAVFLDLRLPDTDGLTVLGQLKELSPETPVIIITGYGSIESAVEAIKLGAHDYLTKPFTPEELRVVTQKALHNRTMILENILLRRELKAQRGLEMAIGPSKAMRNVLEIAARAAPTDSAVIVTGESGTGKEFIAREIHRLSGRHSAPFVVVDCSSLAESLLEIELFGRVKGSLAGGNEAKHGGFELAHGGTIFFNEICNLSPGLQGKLLQVIQQREVTRLGGTRPIKIDARIISASSVNVAEAVSRGAFREDLFYRLSVVPIHISPLRERKEDIPNFVEHFLRRHSPRGAKAVSRISTQAMLALTEYDWPGNIRELENTIERAVVLSRGDSIEVEDLLCHGISLGIPALAKIGGKFKTLEDVEKEYIKAVLRDQNGNKNQTAAILGIDRKTLWAKIKRYNL